MEIGEPNAEPSQGPPAWHTELAERVQEYRQRRAHLHKDKRDSQKTLEFDFDSPSSVKEKTRPSVIEFPSAEELERRSRNVPQERPDPPSAPLDTLEFDSEDEGDEAEPIARAKTKRPVETGPLEIELGPSPGTSSEGIGEAENSGISIAPLATRFAAGILDALILLTGAAIFALVFWKTGGRFSPRPIDLAAGGLIGVFFLFLYFAGCTAVASATPGLIWAGLEVRTFEGNPPEFFECFWRAFGYLVSGSALMLGFVWSVVDADRLTWHDRMSGTFLTSARHQ